IVAGFLAIILSNATVLRTSGAGFYVPGPAGSSAKASDMANRLTAESGNQDAAPPETGETTYAVPTEETIDTSRLDVREKKEWEEVVRIVNLRDATGTYVNPQLHRQYDRLNRPETRTFFIEDHCFEEDSGTLATTTITKVRGSADFSEMVIQLDFNKVRE